MVQLRKRGIKQWQYIKKKKQTLGECSIVTPIGTVNASSRRNEGSKQSVKHRLGSENSLTSWAVIWI